HEAVRPTSVLRTPDELKQYLDKDQFKLYTLIWSRFVASQMTQAILDTMKVTLEQNGVIFIANGSKIKFKGFMQLYVEGRNDGKEENENILTELEEGEVV
ncbi:DNA topoisomerase I, partial [Enterococcus faecium]|uniref:DNA topoisomerase n=1 Tax=Enterococcus faecium TaxID=1352 RepID=UPI000B55CEB0